MTGRFRLGPARVLLIASTLAAATSGRCASLSGDDYARAERFLAWNQEKLLPNGDVLHHWLARGDRFWYRHADAGGAIRFVVVDAKSGARRDAFDHTRLATILGEALG